MKICKTVTVTHTGTCRPTCMSRRNSAGEWCAVGWVRTAWFFVFASVFGGGCAGPPGRGAARIIMQALQIGDIAQVDVTVMASEIPAPLVIPMARSGTQFSATAGDLPVGSDYSFTVSARFHHHRAPGGQRFAVKRRAAEAARAGGQQHDPGCTSGFAFLGSTPDRRSYRLVTASELR